MNENTKTRIIQKAIELFNEHGYENVSMRNIADSLHMSPGNLTYHFNKKTDILFGIIKRQIKEYEKGQYKAEITLSEFNDNLQKVSRHQRKYAFYYRSFVELHNKYPMIAKIQADFKAEFIVLMKETLQYFLKNDWLKEECQEGMYNHLALAILSITTFWTQFDMDKDMTEVIWSILFPNLSEKGQNEYKKIEKKPSN